MKKKTELLLPTISISGRTYLVRAEFLGKKESLGYKPGRKYNLVLVRNGILSSRSGIEIWRVDSRSRSTGYCPYSSDNTFLQNWKLLTNQEIF